jgi:protein-S-isoprenylcysteine O-methyltransferase Ste14
MLQIVALIELMVGWIVWFFAFTGPSRMKHGQEKTKAKNSRWGIGLVMVGFMFAFAYVRPVDGVHKPVAVLIASMILVLPSVVLAWAAARQLGKQWRFQAAISEGHELITAGPYRVVRHPIYTSMLMMLVATTLAWTWWPMAVAAIAMYVIGTEIRVRAEEKLLTEHFGNAYIEYRRRTRAYIPFIR